MVHAGWMKVIRHSYQFIIFISFYISRYHFYNFLEFHSTLSGKDFRPNFSFFNRFGTPLNGQNLLNVTKAFCQFSLKCLLKYRVKGTIGHVADSVLLGRDSNQDPDCYRANSIHDSDNNNSNNHADSFNNLGDGSSSHIFRCGSKRCQFQNKFVPVNNILSTTTNRLYKCIVPAGSTYVNDHSSNMVYLITCNKCKLQYVGETSQNLNKRFNWHNSCFRNPNAYSFCKILNTHLSEGYSKDSSYTVNIIEKPEAKGWTERNTMDFAAKPLQKAS